MDVDDQVTISAEAPARTGLQETAKYLERSYISSLCRLATTAGLYARRATEDPQRQAELVAKLERLHAVVNDDLTALHARPAASSDFAAYPYSIRTSQRPQVVARELTGLVESFIAQMRADDGDAQRAAAEALSSFAGRLASVGK